MRNDRNRPDVQLGDIVDVPKGADPVCLIRHRVEVTQINDFAVSGPRIKADGSRMVSQSSVSADENGFYIGVVTWDVLAKATVSRQGAPVTRPSPAQDEEATR